MASIETRQKIPVPRRSFLWSLNETSGEIVTHVGPTEFTPSANDRIVRANDRGGFEAAPMEARPFVVARDGEYVMLTNPLRNPDPAEDSPNGPYSPGGNKEKDLFLGTTKIVAGPCAFPLWPGQSAEVRPAHKLSANHYLLVEVVGPLDEKARYYRLVIESAGLSSAVIDAGVEEGTSMPGRAAIDTAPTTQLRLGQRIVIQGRHTQLFIPPSGIEVVAPIEEGDAPSSAASRDNDADGLATLPPAVAQECAKLAAQVREGLSTKQFSTLKNELRHRTDLTSGQKAVLLCTLDSAFEERQSAGKKLLTRERSSGRQSAPMDPFARRAVVLGPKEFCFLFDADGNARIVRGPVRVFPGPYDTFLQRGSRKRVYDAYELAEHQAVWLRIIAPISREKLAGYLPRGYPLDREQYEAGHEFIVRGQPSVFFPFIEADVVHPETREPHVGNDHDAVVLKAIGIDQKSGIYVRDLRTGMVKMIRGETSYLVDPRYEEHVHRTVVQAQWNLWIAHAELHKSTSAASVTTPWAVSVTIPNNEAVLVTSRHGRRVEVGPKVVLLEYEETLTALRLSRGPSKDGHQTVTTAFLRYQGARVSDTFEVDSADFVRFRVRIGFTGHFEGEPERWFQVDDPVKALATTVRARLREAARNEPATKLLASFPALVRAALLADGALRFPENGMVIEAADVLSVQLVDSSLADLFATTQKEAVRLQLLELQERRKLDSARASHAIEAEHAALRVAAAQQEAEGAKQRAEADHTTQVKVLELASAQRALEAEHARRTAQKELDAKLQRDAQELEASVAGRLKDAAASAQAAEVTNRVSEAHLTALTALEKDKARALAEAEALRLGAIQPQLVGALQAASDSEVMRAAAENMNLVALLGGKSPAELFTQLVRGTPLQRTVESMATRAAADKKP